ncbi:MAG: right-handed parallel beta-helix repeat-containing protein [Bacteroidota bacterium]
MLTSCAADEEIQNEASNPESEEKDEIITTDFDLIGAIDNGEENEVITIPKGTYVIDNQLLLKSGMSLTGEGTDKTKIIASDDWDPGTAKLPNDGVNSDVEDKNAYLIVLSHGTKGVKISNMMLSGPKSHGAIFGNNCDGLIVDNLYIKEFLWSGIRTFRMENAEIRNSTFENAGGKHGNITGGGLYLTWTKDSDFYNNIFFRSGDQSRPFYGIKGREGRNCRIHNNTILVNFSIEFPHENDHNMEIDHNYMTGTVSIPKFGGGGVPDSGITFNIHHNYFSASYALEWARNGTEVHHNLFDFSTDKDGGNLISCWTEISPGPTKFHDNLIKNPGRGVFWSEHVFNNYEFYNNHVIANTTTTPRSEGLFGFDKDTDFSTISIRNNIIECKGLSRPLMRNNNSYNADISNNTLINISDTAEYTNMNANSPKGPNEQLYFPMWC